MTAIKAFIAHSFKSASQDTEDPKDEWVVGEFTKLFDEIRRLNPSFSWERADEAQPRGVRDKVIAAWEDKNLFVAICTKREQVILVHNDDNDKSTETNVIWKTSDWIIQEIGFAIGRGCKLIILLESGIRKPGGTNWRSRIY